MWSHNDIEGVGQKLFSNEFLSSGIGVTSDCVRTNSLTVFSVNWISFLFWVMKRIYLNTWNSMGSKVVNSVLGLAYWGGLGVAKLVLSVSQMDVIAFLNVVSEGFFLGSCPGIFTLVHSYILLAEPFCPVFHFSIPYCGTSACCLVPFVYGMCFLNVIPHGN